MSRENSTKTSSVHFLRFELTPVMISAVHGAASINTGVDHPAYSIDALELPVAVRDSLANDLQAHPIN
jgi:glycerol-3-phosphate dehydrogenase subunit C